MGNYSQNVKVQYGDFIFPVPTPYVSKTFSNEFIGGDLWATRVDITLTGQVALLSKRESDQERGGNNYLALATKRDKVVKAFAGALGNNFQTFIVEGHGTIFTLQNCSIQGVNFESTNYLGVVGYTINLSGYKNDKDFLAANFGVLSPNDSWDYAEDSSGIVSATHTISATGTNTTVDAHDGFFKAKAFVDGRKGTSLKVAQAFIQNVNRNSGSDVSALILNSQTETINRLGGSYSITESYSFASNEASKSKEEEGGLPTMQTANMLLTYTLNIAEDQGSDSITVGLQGQVTGSKDSSVTWKQIKDDFKSRGFYHLADKAYRRHLLGDEGPRQGKIKEPKNLNKDPVSFSITPDEVTKTIGFQISFDNNELFDTAAIKLGRSYFDYQLSFEHDNITDIIEVSCGGNIRARGSLKMKNRDNKLLLDEILKDNSAKIRTEAQDMYVKIFPERSQYTLTPRPSSVSVSQDTFNGTISYSATFSDRDFPENSKLRLLDYSVNITPPNQEYRSVPSCLKNGHYLLYDLKLVSKREEIGINTSATSDDRFTQANFSSAEAEVVAINDFLKDAILDGEVIRLDAENKVENRDQSHITYNRSFSQEKAVTTIELNRPDS